mmetsp:Transcript_8791/g.16981  ORF Transcript_8791/g.16981 Transcript_8791/m.16981 type:complete len:247 (-) Transcript_8791:580-1320(-)
MRFPHVRGNVRRVEALDSGGSVCVAISSLVVFVVVKQAGHRNLVVVDQALLFFPGIGNVGTIGCVVGIFAGMIPVFLQAVPVKGPIDALQPHSGRARQGITEGHHAAFGGVGSSLDKFVVAVVVVVIVVVVIVVIIVVAVAIAVRDLWIVVLSPERVQNPRKGPQCKQGVVQQNNVVNFIVVVVVVIVVAVGVAVGVATQQTLQTVAPQANVVAIVFEKASLQAHQGIDAGKMRELLLGFLYDALY